MILFSIDEKGDRRKSIFKKMTRIINKMLLFLQQRSIQFFHFGIYNGKKETEKVL